MMRRSLLVQFLVVGIVIVVASIAGTTWIVSTAVSRRDAVRISHDARADQRIVSEVRRWAGGQRSWADVGPFLHDVAARSGRRVVLLDDEGRAIADTNRSLPLPDSPGVPVAPLAETYADTLSPISTTVAGAMALSGPERAASRAAAEAVVRCDHASPASIRVWPNGRAVVVGAVSERCRGLSGPAVFPEEQAALDALGRSTNRCLLAQSLPAIGAVELDTESAGAAEGTSLRVVGTDNPVSLPALQRTRSCVTSAWTQLNTDLVPPRAYLVTTAPNGGQASLATLTTDSLARIAAVVVGLVALSAALVLTLAWSTVRRVRSLQVVTEQLRRGRGSARAPERGDDEIAHLGRAVNELAADLERAQQQRDQLTADIAHDLRSPLTNIRGWIEAWRDGLVPRRSEVLDIVDGEAEHLQRLVSDLQTVALTDAHELRAHRRTFDVAEMLQSAVEARHEGTPRIVYRGPARHCIDADPGHVRQVIDNLVSNALVHAHATLIEVRLDADAHRVRIEVADDGVGLSIGDRERVFDRLWRADATRGRVPAGHGLGLTIARRLVELHQGSIDVADAPPHGTVFAVSLPTHVHT